MSGDVQPRKRKDKRRKKDDLSIEESRGTAAVFGEGDILMHSHHDHGTGGHWCAKIIFFSLLAVLVTLIGLIILENRGLSDLEASSVESRYSGMLDAWIEDAPDDDHHDEHTLDLNHPQVHDDEKSEEFNTAYYSEEHQDEDNNDEDNDLSEKEEEYLDDKENEENSEETDNDEKEDDYEKNDENEDEDDDKEEENNSELNEIQEDDDENEDDNENDSDETKYVTNEDQDDNEDDVYDSGEDLQEDSDETLQENIQEDEDNVSKENDEHEDQGSDEENEVVLEQIEREPIDEEPITELPTLPEEDDKEDVDHGSPENLNVNEDDDSEDGASDDDDYLEQEDGVPTVIEKISAPSGKPYEEVEESVEQIPEDSLAEEEEYEKRQEELRREEEEASHQDGGNSFEDEWPDEPNDPYWRGQLDLAEQELQQGVWLAASERAGSAQLRGSKRAQWIIARTLDNMAEAQRDNRLLTRAINAYMELLKYSDRLTDKQLLTVTNRTLERIHFRGNYIGAEPVHRLLIRRFPNEPSYRNNLTISYLLANKPDLASQVLTETLKRWPNDRVALAHYGFVLKTHHNRLEDAVDMMQKALKGDVGPATEPRFYYHLGDALLLLGRYAEAQEVHKRGAASGHFLSPSQRSLYNIPRLKSKPWWEVKKTPYLQLAADLEASWRDILREGEAARALYEKEKEGLKERGYWSQLDLFVRGREIPGRCKQAPVTCSIVKKEPSAAGCRRGQIKFSSLEPGTHVRPHVGPTNCRLRMHLGLSNTKNAYLRVDKETRQWKLGKVLLFDDSFEHEVWHNGTGTRLVLIVDVWHPDLTQKERFELPAI